MGQAPYITKGTRVQEVMLPLRVTVPPNYWDMPRGWPSDHVTGNRPSVGRYPVRDVGLLSIASSSPPAAPWVAPVLPVPTPTFQDRVVMAKRLIPQITRILLLEGDLVLVYVKPGTESSVSASGVHALFQERVELLKEEGV